MDDMSSMQERLADLDRRIQRWHQSVEQTAFRLWDNGRNSLQESFRLAREQVGAGPEVYVFEVLDDVCDVYLGTTSEQRRTIRTLVQGNPSILNQLFAYVQRSSNLLTSSRDVQWLRRGLAAAAIEDGRLDFRDALVALGDLYLAAAHSGIDPAPYFQQAAHMANAEVLPGNDGSTQDLLANFHTYAYFASSVKPKLP